MTALRESVSRSKGTLSDSSVPGAYVPLVFCCAPAFYPSDSYWRFCWMHRLLAVLRPCTRSNTPGIGFTHGDDQYLERNRAAVGDGALQLEARVHVCGDCIDESIVHMGAVKYQQAALVCGWVWVYIHAHRCKTCVWLACIQRYSSVCACVWVWVCVWVCVLVRMYKSKCTSAEKSMRHSQGIRTTTVHTYNLLRAMHLKV